MVLAKRPGMSLDQIPQAGRWAIEKAIDGHQLCQWEDSARSGLSCDAVRVIWGSGNALLPVDRVPGTVGSASCRLVSNQRLWDD